MKDKHSMIFARRLKEERERKNRTQTELAEILGYKNYTTISKWESGDSLPRGKELKALAKYFEVSADYLLGIDTKNNNSSIEIIYNQLEENRQKDVLNFAEKKLLEQQIEYKREKQLSNLDERTLRNLHRYAEEFGIEALDDLFKEVLADTKSDDDVSKDNAG